MSQRTFYVGLATGHHGVPLQEIFGDGYERQPIQGVVHNSWWPHFQIWPSFAIRRQQSLTVSGFVRFDAATTWPPVDFILFFEEELDRDWVAYKQMDRAMLWDGDTITLSFDKKYLGPWMMGELKGRP